MRKLIESTLVSLDGVIEAPERWASFDAEATALSIKQLGNYDAFVMGRVTYEKFYANWGHIAGNPIHRPHQRHAQVRRSTRSPFSAYCAGGRCRGGTSQPDSAWTSQRRTPATCCAGCPVSWFRAYRSWS